MQEPSCVAAGAGKGQQIDGCELRLLARWHKNQHRLLRGQLGDGRVGGLGHGQDARAEVIRVEVLDVNVQRNGTHVGGEVIDAVRGGSDPVAHVSSVGQRSGQPYNAHGPLQLRGDEARPRHHHLHRGALLAAHQVQLVEDVQRHALDGLALLPAPTQHVPVHGTRQDDVPAFQQVQVHRELPRQHHHVLSQHVSQAIHPHVVSGVRNLLLGGDVNTFGITLH
mmetsp:Transcript_18144/g.26196  ORF Transcript_18144/g.26196 Transcript_18144/m.26196 type:complete len:223 (+) Transcript_18144:2660-3328(+)